MTFGDVNNDRYTDIITVNEAKTLFTVHVFDPAKKMFIYQKTFKPTDCLKITNIVLGRSSDKLRLFLTCSAISPISGNHTTLVKFFDKVGKYIDFQESTSLPPL